MKYMLFICGREKEWPATPQEETPADETEIRTWFAEIEKVGARLIGDRLRPTSDATTVRVRDGETLLSDGPFAETTEQIGGFDVLECPSLDEAIELAAKHPVARSGTVEIRPFWSE